MKYTTFLISAIIAAGVITSLVLWHRTKTDLREKDSLISQREQQGSELAATNVRLSNQLARASFEPTNAIAELNRLRGKLETLRQQTNGLAQQKDQKQATPPPQQEQSEQYWKQLWESAGARADDARTFARALYDYAAAHQKKAPSSPDEMASVLNAAVKKGARWSGTNEFEIIYKGSIDKLEGLPFGSVAVVRSQPWTAPDGEERRIYGFMDGHSQMVKVNSEEGRQFEKDHVFLITPQKK